MARITQRNRRKLIATGLWMLTHASNALAVNQVDKLSVTRQQIFLRNLPAEFEDFRIAQLSDIHHSETYSEEQIQRAIDWTNHLAPDLVVLTGDYVTSTNRFVSRVSELLGGLKPREGIMAILGNHDFWVDADGITAGFRRQGIDVLRNSHTRLTRGGAALQIAGIDDLWVRRADLHRALDGTDQRGPRILLSHNPEILPAAAARKVDLVVSGHTHGGQVAFPIVGTRYMSSYFNRNALSGHAIEDQTQIYINRGLGTVFAPVRLLCPPEITIFELHRQV